MKESSKSDSRNSKTPSTGSLPLILDIDKFKVRDQIQRKGMEILEVVMP